MPGSTPRTGFDPDGRPPWWRSRGLHSAVVALGLGAAVLAWVELEGGPVGLRARYGWLTPALWLPAQVIVHVTPLGDLVPWAVLNGSMFGLWAGAAMSWLAWMGSAAIQYSVGRRTARDLGFAARAGRLPRWLRVLPLDHPVFLVAARWFPFMATPINFAAGAAHVPRSRMFWCTALSTAPPALALAAVGVGLLRLA